MNWQKRKRNKRGFTLEQCRKGGSAVRGYKTAEEVRQRVLQDAKGMVLREGVTYTSEGEKRWCKRRALYGRTDQVELLCDGKVIKTTGESLLRNKLKWIRG
jgi:hypothetical protein